MKKYKNPIIPHEEHKNNTSDPFVAVYNNKFYHCYGDSKGVYISMSENLFEIGKAEGCMVYNGEKNGIKDWYAPELHIIGGEFYIYVAPEYDNGVHTMCVLKNSSKNPMGNYEYLGRIKGLEGKWCIDGTVFEYEKRLYFIWSGCSELCLAEMRDPRTISENITVISRPEYSFETKQGTINEGPAVLNDNNGLYVIYSANDSITDDYCLGMLKFEGGDILNAKNWRKNNEAVFEKSEEIFGPGHCSFVITKDGEKKHEYMIYHANLIKNSGWNGRNVFIKEFERNKSGEPVFGCPAM